MAKHIVIIQGHPDPQDKHFCHGLGQAYQAGANDSGHEIKEIRVATLDFPLLRTQEDFNTGSPVPAIQQAQTSIKWADHLVIIYPLWLGTMPALLKGFFEQVFRPSFAFEQPAESKTWRKLLKGKSARIVVTMGMPALVYRWYFGAHSLKSLERNVLGFCGIGPISESLIGMIEAKDGTRREKWLAKMRTFGRKGI